MARVGVQEVVVERVAAGWSGMSRRCAWRFLLCWALWCDNAIRGGEPDRICVVQVGGARNIDRGDESGILLDVPNWAVVFVEDGVAIFIDDGFEYGCWITGNDMSRNVRKAVAVQGFGCRASGLAKRGLVEMTKNTFLAVRSCTTRWNEMN